jgi:hypothetical protein
MNRKMLKTYGILKGYDIQNETYEWALRANIVIDKQGIIQLVDAGDSAVDPNTALTMCTTLHKTPALLKPVSQGSAALPKPQAIVQSEGSRFSDITGPPWTCRAEQLVGSDFDFEGGVDTVEITFNPDRTMTQKEHEGHLHWVWDRDDRWVMEGSTVSWNPGTDFVFSGTVNGENIHISGRWSNSNADSSTSGPLVCQRSSPAPPLPSANPPTSTASNQVNKCLHRDVNYLQSVSVINSCSYAVDLTWCYRKYNSGEQYKCQQIRNLGPNHQIETGGCYQCSFDTSFLAYPTSSHVDLPSEAEMVAKSAGATKGAQYSSTSGASTGDASAMGMPPRRWSFANPSQNQHAVLFELRGDPGGDTDRRNERGDYINSGKLQPGQTVEAACGKYKAVYYRWRREGITEDAPGWSGVLCTESNPIWTRSKNLRAIQFPRE